MNRRSQTALTASPILVGAVTVLVTLVAVFLAYNANQGLPFVPTYTINAEVPDAAELVVGNEVRMGGARVGAVTKMVTVSKRRQGNIARLELALKKDVERLPRDTVVNIRQRSTLGLKYVELLPGRSRREVANGGTLPLSDAAPVVDLEDALNVFDREERRAVGGAVTDLGNGFAGRGQDLNSALAALPELFAELRPVAANLSNPATALPATVRALQSVTTAIGPVSGQLAALFDRGATTFAALASEREAVGQTLVEAPPTEVVSTRVLREIRPVLLDTAALTRELRPGVRVLPSTADRLATAFRAGTPVLRRTPILTSRLDVALRELRRTAREPATTGAILRLTDVVRTTSRLLAFANPFQTRCNYLGVWTRNVPEVISQGDNWGNWFRSFTLVSPTETVFPTGLQSPTLHYTTYPDEGQNGECEAGNENYVQGKQIGAVPGRQPGFTEETSPPPGTPNPPPAPTR